MRLLALSFLLISLWACTSRQRSAAPAADSSTTGMQQVSRPCSPPEPCSDWTIHTPAFDRGEEPARFGGAIRTTGSRVSAWLDTVSVGGTSAPADSLVTDLHPGEHLEASCSVKGTPLEGRVVAIVRDTNSEQYPRPRLAWRFDLDAYRIRPVFPDSVYCEKEYAGD